MPHKKNKPYKGSRSIRIGVAVALIATIIVAREHLSPRPTQQPEIASLPHTSLDVFASEPGIIPPFPMPDIAQPIFPDRACAISDYGAVADGTTKNTAAIARAIDDCASKGGGHVVIPSGTWFTGPIRLRSGIDLHLDDGAELVWSSDLADYLPVVFSRYEGIENYSYSPLISARDAENIAVTGKGKLTGQGQDWVGLNDTNVTRSLYDMGAQNLPVDKRVFGDKDHLLRPTFIEFIRCHSVLMEDFSIGSGPFWTIHPVYSSDIIVRGIDVLTDGKNNDGIDFDSSRNILVENSRFDTNDDAIVLKSGKSQDGLRVNIPTENVVIRHSTVTNGHGAIAIGSEIAGGARDVFAYDIRSTGSQYGVRIKTMSAEIGRAEDMWFQDMNIDNASFAAIQLMMNYGNPTGTDDSASTAGRFPVIRNIHFSGITGTDNKNSFDIQGLPQSPIRNVTFENMPISSRYGSTLSYASDISFTHITGKVDKGPTFSVQNSTNITANGRPLLSK